MKRKRKKQDPLVEYIKANRKGSREAELENHGRPVSHNRIHVSKKVYNRKRMKADAQRHLPYLSKRKRTSIKVAWHPRAELMPELKRPASK